MQVVYSLAGRWQGGTAEKGIAFGHEGQKQHGNARMHAASLVVYNLRLFVVFKTPPTLNLC